MSAVLAMWKKDFLNTMPGGADILVVADRGRWFMWSLIQSDMRLSGEKDSLKVGKAECF